MTINTESTKRTYAGNGVTTQFDYDFKIFVESDLRVSLVDDLTGVETLQALNVDYTITGEGFEAGGKATFITPPPVDTTVILLSNVPYTQPTDYKNQGRFFPETVENNFDRATRQILQLDERLDRALTVPASVSGVSLVLPVPDPLKVIGWAADGLSLENFTNAGGGGGGGEVNTASNLGAGEGQVYSSKSGVDLRFRSLKQGTNVTITQSATEITISAAGGGGGGGSVTSVGLSAATAGISVTGSTPITVSGAWSLSLSANLLAWNAIAPSVKANVSDLAANTGDGMIGYQQTGTGSVARTLANYIDIGPLYARDFGALGDNSNDDTAELQAAIDAAIAQKRELILHPGTFLVSSPLTATGILRMTGAGGGSFAYGTLGAAFGTKIKMTAGSVQTHVLRLVDSNTGGKLEGLMIDADGKAQVALDIKSVLRSTFTDIYAKQGTMYTVRLWCNSFVNTMYCTFINLQIDSQVAGSIGLYLTGAAIPADANTCHNVFHNMKIDYAGAASEGIRVGNSDNNVFYQTYIFSPGATENQGVTLVNEYSLFPIGTAFYHLQTSIKGMFVQSGLNDNYVYGYATDNAQPDPTWNTATSRFFWTDGAGRISNVRSMKEVSVDSGNPIRLNGYLVGNTWIAGNATSITITVGGVTQATFGTTGNTITQPTTFSGAVTFSGGAAFAGDISVPASSFVRFDGASGGTRIRGSSTQMDVFVNGSSNLYINSTSGFNCAYNARFSGDLGFYGAAAVAKPTVTGSKGANAALTSLLTALATLGLITDSSS